MHGRFPLPTLLSHALTAFTIEFDDEPWLGNRLAPGSVDSVDGDVVEVHAVHRRRGNYRPRVAAPLRLTNEGMRTWLTRMREW
jgi:hypothetical protein